MNNKSFVWFPLDNAGTVFPGQNSDKWANVFRVSVQLNEEIDRNILKQALKNTFERIPTLKVCIKNGFFRHYFENNKEEIPLNHDIKNFCYRINFKENNGYLLRVFYHGCKISIDVYHALCDGYGASVFLMTLTGEYLKLKGKAVTYGQFILDTCSEVTQEETEDAYIRYTTNDTKANLTNAMAYHKKGTKLPRHMCNYTAVHMSFGQIHNLSKSFNVTVTELLASVLLYVHYKKQLEKGSRKPVSVQIPVNLRKFFPSATLRNFVLCVLVSINPKEKQYTFEEILCSVKAQLRKVNNKKAHNAYISRTVKIGNQAIKLVPLAVKNFIIKAGFTFGAEYSTTALMSNLGPVKVPEEINEYIKDFSFYTGPGLVNGARCGVASFGDNLIFTFSNIYREDDIERDFLKRLIDMGIDLTVETNRDTGFSDIKGVTVGDGNAYSDEVFIPSAKDKVKLKKYDLSVKERLCRYFSF